MDVYTNHDKFLIACDFTIEEFEIFLNIFMYKLDLINLLKD